MSISMNNVMNNEVKGFAANKALRNAIVNRLYAKQVVITKITITVDDKTNEVKETVRLGTIGYSPVVEAFGLKPEVRMNNVEVQTEDRNGNKRIERITVDGVKYVYCDSLITIECKDTNKIAELAREGYAFTTELEEYAEYRVLGSSPSNEKHAVKYYHKVTDRIATEEDAYNVMDEISGFAFSKGAFVEAVGGKKITKANTRWGNYLSNMQALGQIDLSKDYIAVVHKAQDAIVGDYDFDEQTMEDMKAVGVEIDNHINDGADYYAAELVQEIGLEVGVKLTLNQAVKVALQNRPTVVTGKCMNRTLKQKELKKLAKNANATYYGNRNGRLLMVIDEDGAKMINKVDLEAGTAVIDVYIMAMAMATTTVRTSSQHLIKYMAVDPQATLEFINKQTKEAIDNFVQGQVEDEAYNNTPIMNKIVKALGEEAFDDKLVLETIIGDTFKYVKSAIAKNKLNIPGIYSHMMFDASYALTNGNVSNILGKTKEGFVEAYSEDVLRMYRNEIAAIENNEDLTEEEMDEQLFNLLSGVVIKYPSAMPKEYEIVVYLTKKQVMRRIDAIKDNEDKQALKEYFNGTPYGCTVYAPINAMKNKLAGADVDFDATMTDMSALKFILINNRRKEQKANPGFMGDCTFISYKDIERKPVENTVEVDPLAEADDME